MKTQYDFTVVDKNGFRSYLSIKALDQKQALKLAQNKCKKYGMILVY